MVVQEDNNGAERPVDRQKWPKKRKSPLQIPFPEGGTALCFRSKGKIRGISLCGELYILFKIIYLRTKRVRYYSPGLPNYGFHHILWNPQNVVGKSIQEYGWNFWREISDEIRGYKSCRPKSMGQLFGEGDPDVDVIQDGSPP